MLPMINIRRRKRYFLFVILFLPTAILLGFSLSGCASSVTSASATQDSFTDSDEPEIRKRAVNRLRLAVLYFTDGKSTIALDEVKQAIAADPNWFESYNMRGLIYMRLADFPLASASFQKALSLNPSSAEVKHNYAVLFCKNGRSVDAIKLFAAALDTPGYGQRSNTLVEQGLCQLNAGLRQDAENSFLKSYEIDAGNPVAGYNLALLTFKRGDYVKAQFYARRVNNSESATAETLWLGVKIERRVENKEAVTQLGGQLKKRFPQSLEASALERGAFNE
jgi:type IV pilus assembly protein PilF